MGNSLKRSFVIFNDSVHPQALSGLEEAVFEAAQTPGFVNVGIDMLGGVEKFAGLFVDGLELVGNLKDSYDCVEDGGDCSQRVHG